MRRAALSDACDLPADPRELVLAPAPRRAVVQPAAAPAAKATLPCSNTVAAVLMSASVTIAVVAAAVALPRDYWPAEQRAQVGELTWPELKGRWLQLKVAFQW